MWLAFNTQCVSQVFVSAILDIIIEKTLTKEKDYRRLEHNRASNTNQPTRVYTVPGTIV